MTSPGPQTLRAARAWLLRSSHQLLAVGLLGVVLTVAVVATGVASLDRATTRLDHVNQSLRPASEALESVERNLAAEQAAVHALRPTADLQALSLEGLRVATAGTDAGWRSYLAHATPLAGSAANERSYQRSYRTYQDLQLAAISAQLASTTVAPDSPYDVAYAKSQAALLRLTLQYQRAADAQTLQGSSRVHSSRSLVVIGSIAALTIFGSAFLISFVALRRRERRQRADAERLDLERDRSRLEGQLQQAFDMVRSEEDAFAVIGSALEHSAAGHDAELLIADSSRAHFRQAVTNSEPGHVGCGVGDPRECPATSQTRTLLFDSSTRIATCPHLRDRPEGPCSAVCVPVTIAGKSIGVIHATGADGVAPDTNLVETLSLIARKSGDRLGTLRAFAKTEAQAQTDPLTGLLNRRSLENQVKELAEDGHGYVVAYGDIDHFKHLNDLHGHDIGDRALRLFSRVLRDSVRPSDLPARYGGEEFVIVLPDCGTDAAVDVVERVREQLAAHLADGQVPAFTVSFGVAESKSNVLFSETLDQADHALLQAKSDGRDRVVTVPTSPRSLDPTSARGAQPAPLAASPSR